MARTNTYMSSCTRGKQIKNIVKVKEETLPVLCKLRERTRDKQIKETLLCKLHDE